MYQVLAILCLLGAAESGFIGGISSQRSYFRLFPIHTLGHRYAYQPVYPSVPTPYAFSYVAPVYGGFSSRHESGDGFGHVSGSYKVSDPDGRLRKVLYTAGPEGFKARVYTNEPGTKSSYPAHVNVQSSAPVPPPYYPPKKIYNYGGVHKKIIIIPGSGPWKH
ncbi:cuticle protein 14-like [Limulus polyphemus]|uniref:Cuticle protein 14-like n=1 Tax=Limulus polyphemus TaxID=6850 RepID=A0ABM1BB65_LIMPO|nr:cuticle protein 14-like [Limulus polyphemus]